MRNIKNAIQILSQVKLIKIMQEIALNKVLVEFFCRMPNKFSSKINDE